MRNATLRSIAAGLLLVIAAAPARAEGPTYTIGSSLGLDIYHQRWGSTVALSTSPNSPFVVPAEPGLRVGMVLPGGRTEFAALLGMTVLSGGGDAISSVGGTVEGNYCLTDDPELRPYVGLHLGVHHESEFFGEGVSYTNIGAQIGVRRMVSQGHGSVRLELRASELKGPYDSSLTDVAVRVGYDLWFR